jgi:hypothetical protein
MKHFIFGLWCGITLASLDKLTRQPSRLNPTWVYVIASFVLLVLAMVWK